MRQIAFYGKGGIGKSTTLQNIAACLAQKSKEKILVIGCDPKSDSTRLLLNGKNQESILSLLRNNEDLSLHNIILTGYYGIKCVESGGPEPGIACAGRGIITAINLLEEAGIYKECYDYIFYDVLGDVVCGGFAMPIREGKAKEIYIVTSGEPMSLFAANNIAKCIQRFGKTGNTRLGGIIGNSRGLSKEFELIECFAQNIGSQLMHLIPRNNIVYCAEVNNKTLIEYEPNSTQTEEYLKLTEKIQNNQHFVIPHPLKQNELDYLIQKFLK